MDIPPPILENFYNQGGDDVADDHEHEDEQDPYTQWRLATYSDGSPLLICIRGTADVTKEACVVSYGRTLRTYSNICFRVFGMDSSVLAPTPYPGSVLKVLEETRSSLDKLSNDGERRSSCCSQNVTTIYEKQLYLYLGHCYASLPSHYGS